MDEAASDPMRCTAQRLRPGCLQPVVPPACTVPLPSGSWAFLSVSLGVAQFCEKHL